MSTETVEEMKPLLREYVEKSSGIVNLQWDEHVTRKLPFDPLCEKPPNRTLLPDGGINRGNRINR